MAGTYYAGGAKTVNPENPGTACLDAQTGQSLWARRDIKTRYLDVGAASSPILFGNALVLTCDGQSDAGRFGQAGGGLKGRWGQPDRASFGSRR